jgi:hypothetical protein
MIVNKNYPVIAWWSGGVTSAIACKLCIDWWGKESVKVVFIDTNNEDDDTYRFLKDCERWYDTTIETITNRHYTTIEEVWTEALSLNVATGAVCSYQLKMLVRERFQRETRYSYQAFGYDINEMKRAISMKKNNSSANPIFPLIAELLSKEDCIKLIVEANSLFLNIEIPRVYKLGFKNNNCWKTGCVQGGIGYWQKMKREYPDKFYKMAKMEHDLTDKKGEPVTMLRDQGKEGGLLFLLPHPKYPDVKDISMKKERPLKPLFECNGFCGTNELEKNVTESEINYSH